MKDLRVLDCTLRDGGCVNDFNFGKDNMLTIKRSLDSSGVDIIECGYIDERKGTEEGRTQFIDEIAIERNLLGSKRPDAQYVAMIDYGKFECSRLHRCTENSIDGIRIAFHKKDWSNMLPMCKEVLQKGYKVFIQPMAILRYSDAEILELISLINQELPQAEAFYIVDSFGEMRMDDFIRILYLVDHNLHNEIALGFHSHNNLQLSYANAIQFINYRTKRRKIIDSSVMGMGKGAGNLNTELLLEHLNNTMGTRYCIQPLLDIIDKVFNQIYAEYKWGYAVEYYLSAKYKCTPSYARHFYDKHLMSIEQIATLLSLLDEDKRSSFDRDYADQIYFSYNDHRINDTMNLNTLKNQIASRKVLLIGPGQSISNHREMINDLAGRKDCFSIMLNMVDEFNVDYVFSNKDWIIQEVEKLELPCIRLSNFGFGKEDDIILDFAKWTDRQGTKIESSFEIIVNILYTVGVRNIILAGFDGFQVDLDKNYYKSGHKRNMSRRSVEEMNDKVRKTLMYYSYFAH